MAAAVCHYAVITNRAKFNAAVGLSSALEVPVVKHRAASLTKSGLVSFS